MLGYVVKTVLASELLSLQNLELHAVGFTRSFNEPSLKRIMGKLSWIRFSRPPTTGQAWNAF